MNAPLKEFIKELLDSTRDAITPGILAMTNLTVRVLNSKGDDHEKLKKILEGSIKTSVVSGFITSINETHFMVEILERSLSLLENNQKVDLKNFLLATIVELKLSLEVPKILKPTGNPEDQIKLLNLIDNTVFEIVLDMEERLLDVEEGTNSSECDGKG